MVKGNINQVGRDGWANLIDIIQEVNLDLVIEWQNESRRNPDANLEFDEYTKFKFKRPLEEGPEQKKFDEKL